MQKNKTFLKFKDNAYIQVCKHYLKISGGRGDVPPYIVNIINKNLCYKKVLFNCQIILIILNNINNIIKSIRIINNFQYYIVRGFIIFFEI